MKIYHGGFSEVSSPKILTPSHSMDFGNGFYTEKSLKYLKFIKSEEVF